VCPDSRIPATKAITSSAMAMVTHGSPWVKSTTINLRPIAITPMARMRPIFTRWCTWNSFIVSAMYDPLDVTQYGPEEFRVAVEAAENWGTYVMVHAYTPRAIRFAVESGVKCIEHGQLADEEVVALMAAKGVWWSLQPFLDDEYANPKTGESRKKQLEVAEGTDRAYALARKYKVRTAWGTDVLHSAGGAVHQGAQLAKMTRWYTPFEVLKMATADNGELLKLCGPRDPYPGRLGVIEPGAWADMLLVNGDPLTDIDLLKDPAANLTVIIKGGRIVKDIR